jgi:glycosyl hydrolase family 26
VTSSIRKRLAPLVVILAAVALAVPASASATIQLGVYTPGAPADAQALADYTAMVGRQPEIVMSYRDFGLPLLYSNEASNLRATGQTPMVSWEPDQSLSQIASGSYDSYLHEQAKAAKSWGTTLMIRFGHEMNGTWYSWSGQPESFVAAWRHIVSIFRADGVTNVKWVFSPNIQEGTKYPISPYFPGDEWVDYVGLDGYNWGTGTSWSKWESLQSVFATSYSVITQLSTKPVIITETSSSEAGGEKAAWIRDGFMSAIPQSFPRVTAVVWFNRTQEDDWRINSSQASLDAYRAVVNCSIYGGSGPCEGASEGTTGKKRGKRKLSVQAVSVPQRVTRDVTGTVSYRLSQTARVRIEIVPRGHSARRFKFTRHSRKGRSRIRLERLVRRHSLQTGRYRVVITARDREGERSRPRKDHFRVV